MTYAKDSSRIKQIMVALGAIAAQIEDVERVYVEPPDGPPEDHSVIIPTPTWQVKDETNGKLRVDLTFAVKLCLRRSSFPENLEEAYNYILPFFQAYSDWRNQSLGGLSREIFTGKGGVSQGMMAGQAFVFLITTITVQTEFNIPTGA